MITDIDGPKIDITFEVLQNQDYELWDDIKELSTNFWYNHFNWFLGSVVVHRS